MNDTGLKIVFMGTPTFAVGTLKALLTSRHQVVGVVTAPDKPAGRGQKSSISEVKKFAEEHRLPILQPEKLKHPEFLEALKQWNADLFVVVAFRMLPEVVWAMPPKGTINLHASLLPQFRGAAPIHHAILQGQKETGVTTFFIEKEIDTGKILLQEKTSIDPEETTGALHDRLMDIGAQLVVKTLDAIAVGTIEAVPQVATGPLLAAPKIFKEDARISWDMPGEKIKNLVRGMSPYPGAYFDWNEVAVKVFVCRFVAGTSDVPGTVDTDGKTYLRIACADGWIYAEEIQMPGKKRMPVKEFLKGYKAD